jgi:hypothetical protein
MSTASVLQSQMQPIGRGVRAYFAPVDRVNSLPTIFDPSTESNFDLDAPPAPWIDLGWVDRFQRTAETTVNTIRQGDDGAVAAQYRSALDAKVECDFRNWGKLQMALAGGTVHYNVLAGTGTSTAPCGGRAVLAATLLTGSTATQLLLEPTALAGFSVGDLVAVDVDYRGETGFIGTGITAGWVPANDSVTRDMDYARRVTFNVARVQQKTEAALVLGQALSGGIPAANAAVQKVLGFVDREGGNFFQEWSAIFMLPGDSGGRICYHYPRLQVMRGPEETSKDIAAPIVARTLKATFRALPITDPTDGEQAVCYRSYFPAICAPAF